MKRPGKWAALGAALGGALRVGTATALLATAAQGSPQQRRRRSHRGGHGPDGEHGAVRHSRALRRPAARVKEINAAGGIDGRRLRVIVCNHQLKNQKTCALQLIQKGDVIQMVTCDVEFAAPATQEFINKGMLALSPCIGTDQQGPKRSGPSGRLAFTFGNIAQDEAAAMAEYAYARG